MALGHEAELSRSPAWLFSSGPLGFVDPKPHDDPSKLVTGIDRVGVRGHKVFVGELDPVGLGLGERIIIKMVGAPTGDFCDWDTIRMWAEEIAGDLYSSRLLSRS